jgi:hypothetical protein
MVQDAPVDVAPAKVRSRKPRIVAGAVILVILAALVGWGAPQLIARYSKPSYVGKAASRVATDMGCTQFKRGAKHDQSVYKYHDQGTCVLDGKVVTVTTFDTVADGDAFGTLMKGVIPVLHPTWTGAAYAAGDGWNVADATNVSPQVADTAVRALGAGAVHIIPSGKK